MEITYEINDLSSFRLIPGIHRTQTITQRHCDIIGDVNNYFTALLFKIVIPHEKSPISRSARSAFSSELLFLPINGVRSLPLPCLMFMILSSVKQKIRPAVEPRNSAYR